MIEISGVASVIAVIVIAMLFVRLAAIEKQVAALLRVDAKLDLLLKQANIVYDPYQSPPPDVTKALEQGNRIEAIRHYRAATGAGLKEAKDFVDELRKRGA